jgi:hypothetical protein
MFLAGTTRLQAMSRARYAILAFFSSFYFTETPQIFLLVPSVKHFIRLPSLAALCAFLRTPAPSNEMDTSVGPAISVVAHRLLLLLLFIRLPLLLSIDFTVFWLTVRLSVFNFYNPFTYLRKRCSRQHGCRLRRNHSPSFRQCSRIARKVYQSHSEHLRPYNQRSTSAPRFRRCSLYYSSRSPRRPC